MKPSPENTENPKSVPVRDPEFVLTMLETDQLVATKGRSRFGRRRLSLGVRVMLWSLRIYVVLMLVIVVVSVVRALHGGQ